MTCLPLTVLWSQDSYIYIFVCVCVFVFGTCHVLDNFRLCVLYCSDALLLLLVLCKSVHRSLCLFETIKLLGGDAYVLCVVSIHNIYCAFSLQVTLGGDNCFLIWFFSIVLTAYVLMETLNYKKISWIIGRYYF